VSSEVTQKFILDVSLLASLSGITPSAVEGSFKKYVIASEQAVSQLPHRIIILFAISAKSHNLFVNRYN
jgi:hypothetical protein